MTVELHTAELHNTEVNMDGLLEVLGKNLYSSPAVAIRELIQNAHDACIRRKIEDRFDETLSIQLSVDSDKQALIIEDNGSGLTYEEVLKYLATVGSGYTRVLRDDTATDAMIGYFGLGFLSAYVVSEKVEVWTTSYQSPAKTWHFVSSGGKRFTLEESKSRSVGTKVRLQLSEKFRELSSKEVLRSLVEKYCCLLPISIYLKGEDKAINNLRVPWRLGSDTSALQKKKVRLDFAKMFEDVFEPLCAFDIGENSLNVKGIMWIQDSTGYSTSDYRNVSVFIRNMQITHEGRKLLPLWAGFAGCIVETEKLTPTASREDIQKDDVYYELQDLLASTLINGLKRIAEREPETWRRILDRHNQSLLGAAVADDALFEFLMNDLKVPTSRGEKTMASVVSSSNRVIYVRSDESNNYEEVLFRARSIPVVSGFMFGAASFCRRYGEYHNIKVKFLGTDKTTSDLFSECTIDDDKKQLLQTLFVKDNEACRFSHFEPTDIPMLIIEDKEAKLKKKIEQDEQDKRVGSAALSLARLHTKTIKASATRSVVINMKNDIVIRLLESKNSVEHLQQIASIIRSYVLTLCYDVNDDETDFYQELKTFNSNLNLLMSTGA